MTIKKCKILGAPIGTGAGHIGCQLAPDTLRAAGLLDVVSDLGFDVVDLGNATLNKIPQIPHSFRAKNLAEAIAWTTELQSAAFNTIKNGDFSIFLGGDHSVAFGTIPAVAQYAKENDRPLFILWIDAHTDFHTLDSSESGNIHGMPLSYITGDPSFSRDFPPLPAKVPYDNICLMGIRSVDALERERIKRAGIETYDMRKIDELGVFGPLSKFLEKVSQSNGLLHVSLDVDGIDPKIAPAVGTTVPGGLTYREVHLIMEMLHESNLVTSLDLVELNPLLDTCSKTANLLIELTASLLGRRVLS